MTLDPSLLDIVACPACRSSLEAGIGASELVCTGCGLTYPVQRGIPVLLAEHARARAGE